jgi:hypothetical protein
MSAQLATGFMRIAVSAAVKDNLKHTYEYAFLAEQTWATTLVIK